MNLQIWNDSIIFHAEWILSHVHVYIEGNFLFPITT